MDEKLLNNLLNSGLDSKKSEIIRKVLEKAEIDFSKVNEIGNNEPIPKSQNHINSINNSEEAQNSLRNLLDKLNNK